jgi:type II secretory pathway component GspD/PulD (secretin)
MSPASRLLLAAASALLAIAPALGAVETSPTTVEPPPRGFAERLTQPVSADFQDVDFASAVEFLAESAGVNILLSEQAKSAGRAVTVHLVEMPLHRALEHLLKGQGLVYRYDGETIWVATREEMEAEPMETRLFPLRQGPGFFAAFEPLSEVRESVALKATGLKELTTIKDILEEVVPSVGGRAILLDERSGSLIVTHVPYYLQQIERLLAELDITPAQVLIEARFVEVTFTDAKEWGFDGGLDANAALTKKQKGDNTRSPGLQLSSTGTTLQRGSKIDFTSFTNQTSGSGLNLTFQGILTGTQYSAVLHALADNKKTKTLSAPRVTTLNNQTATIKIVTEFVYATRYEASVVREDFNSDGDFNDVRSSDGKRETRFVNVPQDFVTKDLGILLHVTPSVGQDRRTITLALKPEVSEKKTDDSFGGEVSLPRFTARNLETSVVIENGETVMLGGLMKDTTSRTVTKVPVLGSLPMVGKLFRKEDDTSERSNLLIFVTAQLVSPAGDRLALEPAGDF